VKTLSYTLLDVFTDKKFGGNQLAVFQEGDGLSTEQMQTIARELNLSESVFVTAPSSPTKQKRLRIFTPQVELPMAGHPTIGAAFALAQELFIVTHEGANEWIFEEEVGDIRVTVHKENSKITQVEMMQPIPIFGDKFHDIQKTADLLSLSVEDINTSLPIQSVSSGVPFLYIPVRTLSAMNRINFRTDVWQKSFASLPEFKHIFTFTTETMNQESTVHCRMFAPAMGIAEDPATGGASGPLGAYLVQHSVVPANDQGIYYIRSEQGMEMGRPSQIDITVNKTDEGFTEVKIGGNSVIVGYGKLIIEE
jgi:trans-2,3-dihydro-3-hydroxyanthranilate isomerase